MRNATVAVVLVCLLAGAVPAHSLDRYGGVAVPVAPPTGFFEVVRTGSRWTFVTPEGNAHWSLGVFLVDVATSNDDMGSNHAARLKQKYGTKYVWAEQTIKRLRSWGFNTLGEYATYYVLPTPNRYGTWTNPEKMPFVQMIRPSYYGLRNQWGLAPGPFKDLISATDPTIYTYWRSAATPDVFDPNFEAYVDGWMRTMHNELIGSPWLMGFATDDADDLFGFGPGAEVPAARLHPHIGWLTMVANFSQSANARYGQTYVDRKVYSKYALRDVLATKYGSVQALNAAWGSTYTTLGTDGGWPTGRGVLDESGRSSWIGRDHAGRKASAAALADLDEFLYRFARRYFTVVTGKIRHHAPQHLVFGPATLNGWGGLTHRSILRAAGESLDVLQATARTQQALDLTARYAGDIPLIGWTGMVANGDSALFRYPYVQDVTPGLPTQEQRGATYASYVLHDYTATTASGSRPFVGAKFWALTDSWGEKRNWGLLTLSDNAYDGREAVVAPGVDAWGYSTGHEERDHGDFISSVRQVHADVLRRLVADLPVGASATPPRPTLTALSRTTAWAGSPSLTLTLTGTGFASSSVGRVNGASRPTVLVSASRLTVTLSAADLAAPRTNLLTVFTPAPGGGTSGALALTVVTPTEVIADNTAAGVQDAAGGRTFTGAWCPSAVQPAYGGASLYSCGGGTDSYRWTPRLSVTGTYDVYVRWTASANRSSSASYVVRHSTGTATRTFDQRVNGSTWQLHGRYTFAAGATGYVELRDSANLVVADAVRFVPVR